MNNRNERRTHYSNNGLPRSKQKVVAVGPQTSDFTHEAEVPSTPHLARNCNTYLMTRATMLSAAPRNRSSDHFLLFDAASAEEVWARMLESANGNA